MKQKHKQPYDPPRVTSASFVVEVGQVGTLQSNDPQQLLEGLSWDNATNDIGSNHFGYEGWGSNSQGTQDLNNGGSW